MAVSEKASDLLQDALALHRRGALEEAAKRYAALLAAEPHHADAHYYLGLIACQQGRFAEGIERARAALAGAPAHARAHVLMGRALAALGRNEEALASFDRALALAPDLAQVYGHRADVLSDVGRYAEAVQDYDRALAAAPDRAEDWFNRGIALNTLRRRDEALGSLDRAIGCKPNLTEAHLLRATLLTELGAYDAALQSTDVAVASAPDSDEAWFTRGKVCLAAGRTAAAVEALLRALDINETAQTRALLIDALRTANPAIFGDRIRALLERALTEGWVRPHELTGLGVGLIRRDTGVDGLIARANAAWPARLPASEVLAGVRTVLLAEDQLFCLTLQSAPLVDVSFERLLGSIRHAMLTSASDAAMDDLLPLCCAVARQCFVNEYVFSLTEGEAEQAEQFRAMLDRALAAGAACPASWPAIVGSYFPLHMLDHAAALLKRSWPRSVRELLVQQIEEPCEERGLAAGIPALTSIDGEVSLLVRQQYEENPYPRWTKAGPPAVPAVLKDSPRQQGDVLVAGCGTGLLTIEFARARPAARIFAIDLSCASLAYAKRMAQNFNLLNVEFGQADIMKLPSLGRQFDFIDASGVLHHLADPWRGWRVLLSLLRPGGVMQVGLYSATARRNIVAVRELIAQRGYRPTPADIRRCREEIMAAPDHSLVKSVAAWPDFFTLSNCRDLLFHEQEHRVSLPEIKSFLGANGLQFVGFTLSAPVVRQFRAHFPASSALTDLDCWDAFERDAPQTFTGMYQFGVRKSGAPDPATISAQP